MAKINTVITLMDKFSGPMGNVSRSTAQATKGFESMAGKLVSLTAVMQIFSMATNSVAQFSQKIDGLVSVYQVQYENEVKLESIMRQRMNATKDDIKYIKELASEQQKLGIYGDELILAGAQELSTFVSNKEALGQLIPVLGDMIAQHDGVNASAQTFVHTADMMGKVLSGQTSALSKNGWIFSEQEKQLLQTGTEEERVATLAKIITNNVTEMNKVLGQTDIGAIQRLKNNLGDVKEEFGKLVLPIKRALLEIKYTIVTNFKEPFMNAIKNVMQHMDTFVALVVYAGGVVGVVASGMATMWAVANWPLTLAITLVITLARVIYNLIDQSNNASMAVSGMANQIANAGRIVGAVFGGLTSAITGVMNILYNVFATVYNTFGYAAEMIVNLFTHPIKTIEGMFINLASTVLDIVSTIAGAFDLIFGTSWSASINSANQKLQEWKRQQLGDDYTYFTRLDTKDVNGIINGVKSGAEVGAEIGSVMDTAFTAMNFDRPEYDAPSFGLSLDDDGSLLVSDKGLIDIASDYKELLSRRASRLFEIQLTQMTPQLSISGVTVSRTADVDEVLERLADGFEEFSSSDLTGLTQLE